jgi:hypothetical protein
MSVRFKVLAFAIALFSFFAFLLLSSLDDYVEYKYQQFAYTSCMYDVAFKVYRDKTGEELEFDKCGSAQKTASFSQIWDKIAGLPD